MKGVWSAPCVSLPQYSWKTPDGPLQSCVAPGLFIPSEFTFYLTLKQLVYALNTFDLEETRLTEENFKMVSPEVVEHTYNASMHKVEAEHQEFEAVPCHASCLRSTSGK